MRVSLAYICSITIVASLDSAKHAEAAPDRNIDDIRCGGAKYIYSQELDRCYKRMSTDYWHNGVAKCRLEGASMLVLETRREADYIKSLEAASPNEMHLGLHDMVSEGTFMSIHGEPMAALEFRDFAAGEPNNNDNNEHCIELYRDFTMNDQNCHHVRRYYCEKSPEKEVPFNMQIPLNVSSPIVIIPLNQLNEDL